MTTSKKFSFALFLLMLGCSPDTIQTEAPALVLLDQGAMQDMLPSTKPDLMMDDGGIDMVPVGDQGTLTPKDMSVPGVPDMNEDKEVKFVEFLQSDWEVETPCHGTVVPPQINGEFQYPERGDAMTSGKSSRASLEALANSTSYLMIHRRTFGADLRPNRTGTILHRIGEGDVHLYVHTIVLPEDLDRTSGNISVLVDYKPVEAIYNFSQGRWDNRVFSKQATGTTFPIDTQFSMMEIVLPAELFSEKRVYELNVSQLTSRYAGTSGGLNEKIHLLNQSHEQQSHPCYEVPLDESANLLEYSLIREGGASSIMIVPAHYPAPKEIAYDRLIPAEPGQEVTINLSLRSRYNAEGRERPVFLKPLLDGKPLEDEWRVSLAKEGANSSRIDARKSFSVKLPEEPGIYRVNVAAWQDPHLMAVQLDGSFIGDVSFGGPGESSNLLRFEVKAPEDSDPL